MCWLPPTLWFTLYADRGRHYISVIQSFKNSKLDITFHFYNNIWIIQAIWFILQNFSNRLLLLLETFFHCFSNIADISSFYLSLPVLFWFLERINYIWSLCNSTLQKLQYFHFENNLEKWQQWRYLKKFRNSSAFKWRQWLASIENEMNCHKSK